MPQGVVGAAGEHVYSVTAPGDGSRVGGDDATEGFPATPGAAVPPAVPQGVVGAAGEHVQPVCRPGGSVGGGGDDPAQRFPTPAPAAVNRLDKTNIIVLLEEAVGAARAHGRPHEGACYAAVRQAE